MLPIPAIAMQTLAALSTAAFAVRASPLPSHPRLYCQSDAEPSIPIPATAAEPFPSDPFRASPIAFCQSLASAPIRSLP